MEFLLAWEKAELQRIIQKREGRKKGREWQKSLEFNLRGH
jgi:hypothetical protein